MLAYDHNHMVTTTQNIFYTPWLFSFPTAF
jgi:hypothetical protein